MDYPNGLPNCTTLKWTTPKNNNPNEYYLKFLAASIIKLRITWKKLLFHNYQKDCHQKPFITYV